MTISDFSRAISVDPVLVSKLFVFANSAYYSRGNITAETLDSAISRLGFETVRNTAVYQRAVWARGMKLSCMGYAVAKRLSNLNHETAYLCGLMHEVGKLYILTKAEDFRDDVAESSDPATYVNHDTDIPPTLVDVMVVAKSLVDGKGEKLTALFEANDSFVKLGIDENVTADVMLLYRDKLQSMQQSLL